MGKIRIWLKDFEDHLSLGTKRDRVCFWCLFSLLVLYVQFAVFSQFAYFDWLFIPLNLIFAVALIPLCFTGIRFCAKTKLCGFEKSDIVDSRSNNSVAFLLFTFSLTFVFFYFWYIAFYPGSFSDDSIAQYSQAVSGNYSNWHPTLHTWLFFKLPIMIFGTHAAIVPMQILYFSAAVAYLFYVLYISGCKHSFLAVSWLFVILNPNTAHIVLYPWKDTAFSIFTLVIFTYLIRIYESKGEWLKRPINVAAFSLFVFLANTMRHNAVLLTIPLLAVIFVFIKNARKGIVISLVSVLLASFLLTGPIYSLASVQKAGHRQVETLGLPMTVLSNIYVNDKTALSEEAIAFMDSLASDEEWEKYHVVGNFNVLKWSTDKDIFTAIEEEGAINILKYTVEAALNRPGLALEAFVNLTRIVWGFEGGAYSIPRDIVDNSYGIEYSGNVFLATLLAAYATVSGVLGRYFFGFTGTVILFMMFFAISRIGKCGMARSFAILPPLVYNFGTMLLLSGPDFRFFYFNFLTVIPIVYLIFSKGADERIPVADCGVENADV